MGKIESNTPYDDVYRTMYVECDELVLPLLNEVFHETYRGNERIIRRGNEHFEHHFYIFNLEAKLPEYERDGNKLEELKLLYADIQARLEDRVENGELTSFSWEVIRELSNKVVWNLAGKYEQVFRRRSRVHGVESIQG